jgi:hypothetical protein
VVDQVGRPMWARTLALISLILLTEVREEFHSAANRPLHSADDIEKFG